MLNYCVIFIWGVWTHVATCAFSPRCAPRCAPRCSSSWAPRTGQGKHRECRDNCDRIHHIMQWLSQTSRLMVCRTCRRLRWPKQAVIWLRPHTSQPHWPSERSPSHHRDTDRGPRLQERLVPLSTTASDPSGEHYLVFTPELRCFDSANWNVVNDQSVAVSVFLV